MSRLILICAAVALALSVGGSAQTPSRRSSQFGRTWWLTISYQNAEGFLDGYQDCLPSKAQRSLPGWSQTTETLIKRINLFYSRHKDSQLDAGQVALKVAAATPARATVSDGEVYTNRHGYYDGLWWKGSPGDEGLGYVEGYLVCLGRPATMPEAKRLADKITAWYRQHPSKEDRAIAYVLEDILKAKKDTHHCKGK